MRRSTARQEVGRVMVRGVAFRFFFEGIRENKANGVPRNVFPRVVSYWRASGWHCDAWLARLSEGSRNQAPCQWLFLAFLGLMGMVTMLSVALGPRYWLVSGATLSVMVLAAIWDFRDHVPTERLENLA